MVTNEVVGYIHPEKITVSSGRGGRYKTFNENGKPRKNEVFTGVEVSKYSVAAISSTSDTMCPTCNTEAVNVCFCVFGDKTCTSGHTWYTNREGNIIRGNPHKNN
jgi:hypothetical protein